MEYEKHDEIMMLMLFCQRDLILYPLKNKATSFTRLSSGHEDPADLSNTSFSFYGFCLNNEYDLYVLMCFNVDNRVG